MNNRILRTGFTLIELLVVLAIIAILSALALFNFSEAQTRSKLTRARADMRTIALALEAYHTDANAYPPAAVGDVLLARPLDALTSPHAYLTRVPEGPFGDAPFSFAPEMRMSGYNYKDAASTSAGMPGETYGQIWRELPDKKYMLHSCGPNQRWDVMPYIDYDATNGTCSNGDLCVLGPLE